jgi:hypothetical protein
MATEMLSYRQLGQRLGCSRDAARELVKRLRLPRHKTNDGKAVVSVDLSEINHNLTPTHVTASLNKCIESAELERERERAERLMAELLRAKADALASRATVTRLEGELAALRSRPWWRRLGRTRQPSGSFDVPQMDTKVQALA